MWQIKLVTGHVGSVIVGLPLEHNDDLQDCSPAGKTGAATSYRDHTLVNSIGSVKYSM